MPRLCSRGVVDHQVEQTRGIECQDHGHTDLVGQGFDSPGAAAEEVIEAIERMALDSRDHRTGLDGLEDPVLSSLADTHDPAQEDVSVGLETRFGEDDGHGLQERVEGWDDRPHGGRLLVSWGVSSDTVFTLKYTPP
jgi:hypothetical protein